MARALTVLDLMGATNEFRQIIANRFGREAGEEAIGAILRVGFDETDGVPFIDMDARFVTPKVQRILHDCVARMGENAARYEQQHALVAVVMQNLPFIRHEHLERVEWLNYLGFLLDTEILTVYKSDAQTGQATVYRVHTDRARLRLERFLDALRNPKAPGLVNPVKVSEKPGPLWVGIDQDRMKQDREQIARDLQAKFDKCEADYKAGRPIDRSVFDVPELADDNGDDDLPPFVA